MSKEKLIVILGPTAVGKTSLAVSLAKRLKSRVLSGDSMLVYRGFDIGTAKPTKNEMDGVVHEFIDILNPDDKFDVSDFCILAREKITEANKKGEIPVLAGGTGLYVKSLLEGYEFNKSSGDEAYRKYLEDLANIHGKEYVHRMLSEIDAKTAERLHVNDFRRVVRALEVHHLGGEKISTRNRYENQGLSYNALVIGLRRKREILYERINKRVDLMVENGIVDEVKNLLSYVPKNAQALKGIGYKEVITYLNGECTFDEAINEIKKNTRHFAKRQFTWYRKMPYINWIDVDEMSEENIFKSTERIVRDFFDFTIKIK